MNTRKNEKEIIQEFFSHDNNTHKMVVTNSVGMALIRLYEAYFPTSDITDQETTLNKHYEKCIKEIYEQAPQDKMSACDYLKKLCEAAINQFDYVTLFIDGNQEKRVFPLKQVITLVWLALNDKDKYKSHLIELNQEARQAEEEKNHADRLLSFYTCLQSIQDNPVCHHGNRNEFVFLLNNIYPGLELIEDERATILSFLKDALSNAIVAFYKNTESGLHEKAIHQAILEWIIKDTPQPLIACLGLEDALRKNLSQLFIKHGTNPYQLELNTLIDHALPCLTFSCDIQTHKGLYFAAQLFQSLSESKRHPESSEALSIAREEVRASENLNAPNLIAKLEIFCLFYTTYHYYIENQNLLIITGQMSDLFTALITRLKNYFDEMIKNKSLLAWNLCAEDTKAITQLSETILSCQKDTMSDQIANFFWKYFDAKRTHNPKLLSIQYSLLLNENFKSKLQLTERDCQNLYASQREGILEIGAYEINRIFLYAIITPVHQWSATFGGKLAEGSDALQGGLFPRVLSFVKNKFEQADTIMTSALKNESYPEDLINQLEYLSNKYRIYLWEDLSEEEKNSKHQFGFDENKRPKWMLLLPHQVITSEEWINVAQVLKNLGEDVFESHYRPSAVNIHRILKEVEIIPALKTIPKAYRLSYVKQHTHQVRELASILPLLPQQDWPEFIRALDKNITNIIPDGNRLKNVLSQLENDDWPVFINALGNTIQTIIKNEYQFEQVLLLFHNKNGAAFINALGNTVQTYIRNENQLSSVLYTLPKQDQPGFINALGKKIQSIIQNGNDLKNVLSRLENQDWPVFINALGNTIQTIIPDGKQLGDFLSVLSNKDWPAFINALGNTIHMLIRDGKELRLVLYRLFYEDHLVFIKALGNSIQTIIRNGKELGDILHQLQNENRPVLIHALGNTIQTIIRDENELGDVLSLLQNEDRPMVINGLGNTIQTIIPDGRVFSGVLSRLPKQDRLPFINALGKTIQMLIRDGKQLGPVLFGFSNEDWPALIQSLCNADIKTDYILDGKVAPKMAQTIQHASYVKKEINKIEVNRIFKISEVTFFNINHSKKMQALEAFYACLFTSDLPECNVFASMDPEHIRALLSDVETKDIINKILDDLGLKRDFAFDIPSLNM